MEVGLGLVAATRGNSGLKPLSTVPLPTQSTQTRSATMSLLVKNRLAAYTA